MSGAEPRPSLLLAVGCGVLLLWPTLLNWHPYLFWDTYGYFLQGKAYATLLMAAAGLVPLPPEAAAGWLGAAGRMLADDASIRSPVYSLILYTLAALGSFWLVALTTALTASVTLEIVLARLTGLAMPQRLLVWGVGASVTTLPWFASYLMPDLFAGLLLLAAATLAFAWSALRCWEQVWLIVLMLLAGSFHSSHLLLGLGLGALTAVVVPPGERLAAAARVGVPQLGAVALLLIAAWLGFGSPSLAPNAPPFLLARTWEDGPARAYLEATCPQRRWAICEELRVLAPSAQEFLWRDRLSYWNMDPAKRAAIRAEAPAIVLGGVLSDPVGQARASLRNLAAQLARFGLADLVVGRGAAVTKDDYEFVYLPQAPAAVWGLDGFAAASHAVTGLAVLVLLAWCRREPRGEGLGLVLLILLGIVLNAAICGVLSGPHDRYQARVIWTLPVLAAALALSRARSAPAPAAPSGRRARRAMPEAGAAARVPGDASAGVRWPGA